jgi:hypothetical protein
MCYTYVGHFNADVRQNKEKQTVDWEFGFSWLLYHFKWQIITGVVKGHRAFILSVARFKIGVRSASAWTA